jgi:SSS family solute:Na+ symporter
MNIVDWLVIGIYLSGMIGLSVFLGRNQSNEEDYYIGGRKLPWLALGISTMATQTSAISFISKPAFVALRPGGGLTWLQYELAVPLAIIAVLVFLVPFFRKLELLSVYEYLELRFNAAVRYLVSLIFLISRGLAAGVVVYTTAIVLSVCLEIPLWITILIIGVITIIYDTIGGMPAVVYSDVIQMSILLSGIILCIVYAANSTGGLEAVFTAFPSERLNTLDLRSGLGDGSPVPFWGFLTGGFFLFFSYYGTDQSQVQRQLSAESTDDARKSIIFNGFSRFPLTLLYMLLGMSVWAVYQISPELQASVPRDQPDSLIPRYILLYLPGGIRGILFAAILAAAMSSLDSVLNSLSASTMRDFIRPGHQQASAKLRLSKLVTVCWGIIITGFAFLVSHISHTVIEAINMIGSVFYGPILASFLVGILSKRVNAAGIFSGILAGVSGNLILWIFAAEIHWMWWNVSGCLVTVALTFAVSLVKTEPRLSSAEKYMLRWDDILKNERPWIPVYLSLICYFVLMLSLLIFISRLAS